MIGTFKRMVSPPQSELDALAKGSELEQCLARTWKHYNAAVDSYTLPVVYVTDEDSHSPMSDADWQYEMTRPLN